MIGPTSASDYVPPVYDLRGLANVLTGLFSIIAVLEVVQAVRPSAPATATATEPVPGTGLHISGSIALVVGLMTVATVVLFLMWFHRARQNAGRTTWPQSRSPGWAIGGWFLPPVFLWFPYQMMADIWRAGRPPDKRTSSRDLGLVGWWWACWLLAWFTSYQHRTVTTADGFTSSGYTLNFGGTRLSAAFGAAAVILLVVIIRKVSAGPVGNPLARPERGAVLG